ncbi:hypothetical protein BJ508DRAFT_332676 [Ascobolus immersus RN42]|uniref:Uncharacterized protein n=1 Tax=Ascobolus immersus RN42 TaxID=1160509 RepID=A0A3N4HLY1_ASCIM|nr:hypothetical protein BJ508DRAFT_332676 [Ascobolus immersus RN42]
MDSDTATVWYPPEEENSLRIIAEQVMNKFHPRFLRLTCQPQHNNGSEPAICGSCTFFPVELPVSYRQDTQNIIRRFYKCHRCLRAWPCLRIKREYPEYFTRPTKYGIDTSLRAQCLPRPESIMSKQSVPVSTCWDTEMSETSSESSDDTGILTPRSEHSEARSSQSGCLTMPFLTIEKLAAELQDIQKKELQQRDDTIECLKETIETQQGDLDEKKTESCKSLSGRRGVNPDHGRWHSATGYMVTPWNAYRLSDRYFQHGPSRRCRFHGSAEGLDTYRAPERPSAGVTKGDNPDDL